jgi:hypothetical protein
MARGEGNLLFGKPVLVKKDEAGIKRRFFPSSPEALSLIANDLVFLSDTALRAVSPLGNEKEIGFPLELTCFSNDSLLSLTSFGAAWSGDGRIFYHSLTPDEPIREIASEKDAVALHLSNNRLYLLYQKDDRLSLVSAEISDLEQEGDVSWKEYFDDDDVKIDGIYHSAKEALVFSRVNDELQIDLLPENGWIKTWRVSQLSEDVFAASDRVSYSSLSGEDILFYMRGKNIMALSLKEGKESPLFMIPDKIRDFSIKDDRISILTADTLAVYEKGLLVRVEKLPAQAEMILDREDDLLLWTPGEKEYFLFDDIH